jgi:hypothetical protein
MRGLLARQKRAWEIGMTLMQRKNRPVEASASVSEATEKNQRQKAKGSAVAAPYEPTPREKAAIDANRAQRIGESPSPDLKVVTAGKATSVAPDHPDRAVATKLLMKALGTTDPYFVQGLMTQLANAGSKGQELDQDGINFMLSVVKGIEPKDEIEAMLAAQMVAAHMASMTFARRLAHVENLPQQDSAERTFTSWLGRNPDGSPKAVSERRPAEGHGRRCHGPGRRAGHRRQCLASWRGVSSQKPGDDPMNSPLPMHLSLRCHAQSERTKERCRAPAVRGWEVCRFHGAGGGGPKGKANGNYRHSQFTCEAIAERRVLADLIRLVRASSKSLSCEEAPEALQ